jgi:uncharacterized protein YigA (DUF484 family)
MTTRDARGTLPASEPEEEPIAAYLQHHPDFFERHLDLLARLRLPHVRSGATVSLVERQISVLREKHAALERQLAELVRAAHANELLAQRLHRLARLLMRSRTRAEAVAHVEVSLRGDFDVLHPVLLLIGDYPDLAAHRFVRQLPAGDASLKPFESLFERGKPRCGQPRDSQRELLFAAAAQDVRSAALLPLGIHGDLGLLALGSTDSDRFHPGVGTDLLAHMAELVADALAAPVD